MSETKWENMPVVAFDGGYSRTGEIVVFQHPEYGCHVCKRLNVPVISGDGSEGEYDSGRICESCAVNAFAQFREAHTARVPSGDET